LLPRAFGRELSFLGGNFDSTLADAAKTRGDVQRYSTLRFAVRAAEQV
jgi:hypothetical protein